jgi:hypothetical protein
MDIHSIRTHIPQAENHNAWETSATGGHQFAKVKVVSEEHATLVAGFAEYARIGQTAQALLVEMNCVVPQISKERNAPWRNAHVGQELHALAISIG